MILVEPNEETSQSSIYFLTDPSSNHKISDVNNQHKQRLKFDVINAPHTNLSCDSSSNTQPIKLRSQSLEQQRTNEDLF